MKKKKKGFTLIELLAIIVILAIIAVITVPIILNIIENSKRGAVIDSAYGYKDSINKYYVTELAKNSNFSLDGEYNVGEDGSITSTEDETKKFLISFSGTKPSGGNVTIDDSVVTSACLVIDEYEVKYENNKFTTNGKGNCDGSLVGGSGGELGDDSSVLCPETVKFNDNTENSWECIVQAVQNNKISGMQVGDTKKITLTGEEFSGKEYTLRIANTSTPNECQEEGFSQTACGFVLEFADIITKYNLGSDTWPSSYIRTYLTNTIYESLPQELKDVIIDTYVVSGHGAGYSDNFTTTDKLYLLSIYEVWGNDAPRYDTSNDKTRQLDYYQGITEDEHSKTIKKYNGIAMDWWLRGASPSDDFNYYYVTDSGTCTVQENWNTFGVSPAFRIGK